MRNSRPDSIQSEVRASIRAAGRAGGGEQRPRDLGIEPLAGLWL